MNQERIMKVILAPHITEKAANVGESSNQYVFKVATDATKPEIKQAVETLFEVSVLVSAWGVARTGRRPTFASRPARKSTSSAANKVSE